MNQVNITLFIADSQPIFREGVKAVVANMLKFTAGINGEAGTAADLLRRMDGNLRDQVLLLDLHLPDMDGIAVIGKLRDAGYTGRILLLGMVADPKLVQRAFKAGTDGYLLKQAGPEELELALDTVWEGNTFLGKGLSTTTYRPADQKGMHHGGPDLSYDDRFVRQFALTKRELEVLKLIGKAMSNKDIASLLFISEQTASVHRKNIMRKTGVSNSVSLIKMAYDHHLL